jgi:hypothetical protein
LTFQTERFFKKKKNDIFKNNLITSQPDKVLWYNLLICKCLVRDDPKGKKKKKKKKKKNKILKPIPKPWGQLFTL